MGAPHETGERAINGPGNEQEQRIEANT